jgi:hypothetical protein
MSTQHRYRTEAAPLADAEELARLHHAARDALSIVLMTTEALQVEIWGPLGKGQQEALAKIHENSIHLQTLLVAILAKAHGEQAED